MKIPTLEMLEILEQCRNKAEVKDFGKHYLTNESCIGSRRYIIKKRFKGLCPLKLSHFDVCVFSHVAKIPEAQPGILPVYWFLFQCVVGRAGQFFF